MDLAVGEIFAQGGSYYQVCLDTKITCAGCVFDGHGKCSRNKEFYIIGRGRVNEGLHLFTELGSAELVASRSSKRVVFECEIPEGAYYFLNLDKTEICTNKFRFIKEV